MVKEGKADKSVDFKTTSGNRFLQSEDHEVYTAD